MSVRYLKSEMTMEDRSSRSGSRERLGLSFTIDYLLFNKGVKGSREEVTGGPTAEETANATQNNQSPKPKEAGNHAATFEKRQQRSEAETEEREVKEEEGAEEQQKEGEEEVTTTTATTPEKSADKPNQSYIALISKAILASEQKKLLLCDIYQWIMDHYPYFKSKVCSHHFSYITPQSQYTEMNIKLTTMGVSCSSLFEENRELNPMIQKDTIYNFLDLLPVVLSFNESCIISLQTHKDLCGKREADKGMAVSAKVNDMFCSFVSIFYK